MSNGNTVTLVGNVIKDPELRFTPSGLATAQFSIAVNRRKLNQQTQDWEESTSFFDIVCWREMAENASESFSKGTRIIVTGRLEQRTWETPEGEKRSRIQVSAEEIGPSLRWATATVTKNERRSGASESVVSGGGGVPSGIPAQIDASLGGYGFDEEGF